MVMRSPRPGRYAAAGAAGLPWASAAPDKAIASTDRLKSLRIGRSSPGAARTLAWRSQYRQPITTDDRCRSTARLQRIRAPKEARMSGSQSDPRHHTRKMKARLQEDIAHLREDVHKVDEPQLKAMFETS